MNNSFINKFKILKNKVNNKRVTPIILALVLLFPPFMICANDNVTIKTVERPEAAKVENMTIIIGTHMIAINSLTPELNEIAEKTAKDSEQQKVYYKSELSDLDRDSADSEGVWFEVQDARDIGDILLSGKNRVDDEVIDRLVITHYTDENGVTYDLTSGEEVDIFNIKNVYDVASMEEMESVDLEYKAKKDSGSEDKKEIESLKSILELDVKDEYTSKLDETLEALRKYSDYLVMRDAPIEEREKLMEIRGAVNAQRRAIVVGKLIDKLDEEIKNNDSLSDTYGDAKNELLILQSNLDVQSSMLVTDSNSGILHKKEKYLVNKLIANVQDNNYPEADINLKKIIALNDISSNIISNKDLQESLLEELGSELSSEYDTLIDAGESDEYKTAKSLNKSQVVLDSLKNNFKDKLNEIEGSIDLLENMKIKLIPNREGQAEELQKNIDRISSQIGRLSSDLNREAESQGDDLLSGSSVDEFKKIALGSLQRRLENEMDKLSKIEDSLDQDNEDSKQEAEMNRLNLEYQKSLDKNDLLGAQQIKNEIDILQSKVNERQRKKEESLVEKKTELDSIQSQLDSGELDDVQTASLESQKALLKSNISKLAASASGQAKTSSKVVNEAKKEVDESLSKIPMTKDDVNSLLVGVDKIIEQAGSQVQVAYPAIVDIYEDVKAKMETDKTSQSSLIDVLDSLKGAVAEYSDKYNDESSSDLDSNLLDEKIDNFAKDNDLDDVGKTSVSLGALSKLLEYYGNVGDNTSTEDLNNNQKIIKSKLNDTLSYYLNSVSNGDSLVSVKNTKSGELYVPAQLVAYATGMRYIWEPNLVRGCMIGNGTKYIFTHGKGNYLQNSENANMFNVAIFQTNKNNAEGNLWLPNSFLIDKFGLTIEDIKTTGKTILYNSEEYKQVKNMFEALK